jgi:hypothetical protein
MIWILIIIFTVIFFLFILAFVGLNNINKQTPDKKRALKVNSLLPNKTLKCLNTKVMCDNTEQCEDKCGDMIGNKYLPTKCVKIREPIIKEYSYIFSKNKVVITFSHDSKNIINVNSIKIPLTDKNGENINTESLKITPTVYINFKYSTGDENVDILNANYGNFVGYIKDQVNISNTEVNISLTFKILNFVYDISQEDEYDIAIKWYTINSYKEQGYCLSPNAEELPPCNTQKGGVLTWTGWTNPDAATWSCICRYPAFSNGGDCGQLNPNVCAGGNFEWIENQLPTDGKCTCNKGNELVKDYRGVPYCVPSEYKKWYTTYFTPTGDIIQDARIKK